MTKKQVYLSLAIIGFLVTYYFVFQFYANNEMTTGAALAGLTSNNMSTAFITDFSFAIVAAWVFIFHESKRLNMKYWWAYIPLTLLAGFCFALPLFLYFREGQLERST